MWGFFKRRFWGNFYNMVNIFTCRCPNRSGVGVIDSPDRFEQVLEQRYIPEVSEDFHARHFDDQSSENGHFWCFKGFHKQFYLL
eukprot:UN17618